MDEVEKFCNETNKALNLKGFFLVGVDKDGERIMRRAHGLTIIEAVGLLELALSNLKGQCAWDRKAKVDEPQSSKPE